MSRRPRRSLHAGRLGVAHQVTTLVGIGGQVEQEEPATLRVQPGAATLVLQPVLGDSTAPTTPEVAVTW